MKIVFDNIIYSLQKSGGGQEELHGFEKKINF